MKTGWKPYSERLFPLDLQYSIVFVATLQYWTSIVLLSHITYFEQRPGSAAEGGTVWIRSDTGIASSYSARDWLAGWLTD
jgi:hypothetical protein